MPTRSRYARRRPRRVKKSTALARKGRKAQASQILTLQRQVDFVKRRVKDNTKYTQWQYPLVSLVGGATGPTYGVWNLINPSTWDPIFQARPEAGQDITASKFRGRSIGIEMMAQLSALTTGTPSPDPVTCTFFLCSLRKEVAKQFVHDTNNGIDLEEGVHYVKANMGTLQGEGMVMLNKGIFKIRKTKRFIIGGATNFYKDALDEPLQATTSLKDNNRRIYWKVPYSNLLKDDGPNTRTAGQSGWRTLTIDTVEPSDQLYVIMFSNAYADQGVAVHANIVATGIVTN